MISEEVTFFNGPLRLRGTLFKPDDPGPHPALIVLHAASGGTRQYPFYAHLEAELLPRGLAVLLYDRRGAGRSEGDFSTAGFEELAGDGLAAVNCLRRRVDIDGERVGLYGVSQGGWIAPIVAVKEPSVRFLVIVSGSALSPAEQMDYAARYTLHEAGYSEQILAQAIALRHRVNEYYRGRLALDAVREAVKRAEAESWFEHAYIGPSEELPGDVTEDKWHYELDHDPLPIWRQVRQPTLFVFGDRDRWVPVRASLERYRRVTGHLEDVTFDELTGLDHLMGEADRQDEGQVSDRYVQVQLNWLKGRVEQ